MIWATFLTTYCQAFPDLTAPMNWETHICLSRNLFHHNQLFHSSPKGTRVMHDLLGCVTSIPKEFNIHNHFRFRVWHKWTVFDNQILLDNLDCVEKFNCKSWTDLLQPELCYKYELLVKSIQTRTVLVFFLQFIQFFVTDRCQVKCSVDW